MRRLRMLVAVAVAGGLPACGARPCPCPESLEDAPRWNAVVLKFLEAPLPAPTPPR